MNELSTRRREEKRKPSEHVQYMCRCVCTHENMYVCAQFTGKKNEML